LIMRAEDYIEAGRAIDEGIVRLRREKDTQAVEITTPWYNSRARQVSTLSPEAPGAWLQARLRLPVVGAALRPRATAAK
jgi:hypothetical protein